MKLESHVTERRDSPIWKFIQHSVVEPIINNFKDCRIDAELVQQVCGILDVNTFELRNFDVSCGTKYNYNLLLKALQIKMPLIFFVARGTTTTTTTNNQQRQFLTWTVFFCCFNES